MIDPSITFFPVENGDTSLIQLSNNQTILIDCNITNDSRDESNDTRYDVHTHLLSVLKKDDKETPFVDAFILTHPDEDHCRGFTETFFVGNPSNYKEKDKKAGLIRIDELWFTPRIFSPHEKDMCVSAEFVRKEAQRRLKLHQEKNSEKDKSGNRLRIIGYSDNTDLKGLKEIISTPGTIINSINGILINDFSFFIHAPFKKDMDTKWGERNDTSVVVQARFDVGKEKNASIIFLGGDSGYAIWEDIIQRSKDETLQWDILLAPHHCSWSFFNDTPYNSKDEPTESSIEFLEKRREGAIIVVSCKEIKNDDDNPPHFAAAEKYKEIIGEDQFFEIGREPGMKKPLPMTFFFTENGPIKKENSFSKSINTKTTVKSVLKTAHTYG